MAVVKFLNTVKYNHEFYPPHSNITVKDADVNALVALGAVIVKAPAKVEQPKVDKGIAEKAAKVEPTYKAEYKNEKGKRGPKPKQ